MELPSHGNLASPGCTAGLLDTGATASVRWPWGLGGLPGEEQWGDSELSLEGSWAKGHGQGSRPLGLIYRRPGKVPGQEGVGQRA